MSSLGCRIASLEWDWIIMPRFLWCIIAGSSWWEKTPTTTTALLGKLKPKFFCLVLWWFKSSRWTKLAVRHRAQINNRNVFFEAVPHWNGSSNPFLLSGWLRLILLTVFLLDFWFHIDALSSGYTGIIITKGHPQHTQCRFSQLPIVRNVESWTLEISSKVYTLLLLMLGLSCIGSGIEHLEKCTFSLGSCSRIYFCRLCCLTWTYTDRKLASMWALLPE